MTELTDYKEYGGDHWELGPLRNALAYQGLRMPHTGQAPSESLLFGNFRWNCGWIFYFPIQGISTNIQFLDREQLRSYVECTGAT